MKKLTIMLICTLIGVQSKAQESNNVERVMMIGGLGMDYPTQTSPKGFHGFYEFDFVFAQGWMYSGLNISGKSDVTRRLADGTDYHNGYFRTGAVLGLKVPKSLSKIFAGSGIGVTGVVLWDNLDISPEFPFGGGLIFQIATGYPIDGKYTVGIFARATPLIYSGKSTHYLDTGKPVTAMVPIDIGVYVTF